MSPISADLGIDIRVLTGVTQDNRDVKAGYLFAALQGEHVDGRDYIDDAISRGASVILSGEDTVIDGNVMAALLENPRKEFSHIVAEFYGGQPDHVIAVTGTNGKSSVVDFTDQLLRALGKDSTYIGTLSGTMTTPDPVSLHKNLAQMAKDGITHVALEASSHGLAQYRMDGVHVHVAAFTSFSQDHLDYHVDMDEYLSAKSRLFSELLAQDGIAVLNADTAEYEQLSSICNVRGVRVLSYGKNASDVKLVSSDIANAAQHVEISVMGESYVLNLPLVGQFQVMNALCALACVIALYPQKSDALVAALEKLEGVAGRLQHVTNDVRHAYVDYAHTPDALENVLDALRPHTKGNLVCVFGCGGDRDVAKRPLMGEIAARLADIAIVTDDNPRSENPADIRKQILDAMSLATATIHEIADRREAIKFAADLLDENDILLVAGKGHEQGQIFDGVTNPFDDVCEVNNALRRVKGKTA